MEIVTREEPSLEWKLSQPTIWATLNCGVRVQQLLPDKFEEVAELIRTQLIPRETMCKALDMCNSDAESCETFVQEALGYMRDGFSIVGIVEEEERPEEEIKDDGEREGKDQEEEDFEEEYDYEANGKETRKRSGESEKAEGKNEASKTERVVAAMIARVVQNREAMETFSRVKVYKGDAYKKYAKLNDHVIRKAGLSSAYNTNSYYRIYHIVVHEDYTNRGISLYMGKLATLRLTALFKQKICVKVCPDRPTQHLMRRLGFEEHIRVGYEEWLEKGAQVFFNTGVGNYSIALMVYEYGENEEKEPVQILFAPCYTLASSSQNTTLLPSIGLVHSDNTLTLAVASRGRSVIVTLSDSPSLPLPHEGVGSTPTAGELGDLNETLEEKEVEPPPGPLDVFPGRAKTGQPSVGNRGYLMKPTPPVVTGRLADYRYLFQRVK